MRTMQPRALMLSALGVCAIVALDGCGGGGGGGGGSKGIRLTLVPAVGAGIELPCLSVAANDLSGQVLVRVDGESVTNAKLHFGVGATSVMQEAAALAESVPGREFSWDTSAEAALAGMRVENVYVELRTDQGVSSKAGPVTIDNTDAPAVAAFAASAPRGVVRLAASVESAGACMAELAISVNGGAFTCAQVRDDANPVAVPGAQTVAFDWDSIVGVPASGTAPIQVTVRVAVRGSRFDPVAGYKELSMTIDNTPPIAFTGMSASPAGGVVQVSAAVSCAGGYTVELALSTNGGATFVPAQVSGQNPLTASGAQVVTFSWDSAAGAPASAQGPVDVVFRATARELRSDPAVAVRDVEFAVDNRPYPTIVAPIDRMTVFEHRRPGGDGGAVVSSFTLAENPIKRSPYAAAGELSLRASAAFAVDAADVRFFGTEEGVFQPAVVFPRHAAAGQIVPAAAYTLKLHGSGATSARATPPMLVVPGTVRVLGTVQEAQLVYVLDPAAPAQALHLEGSTLGLSSSYPVYGEGMPGGSPRAVVGIQAYTAAHGLVGLVQVDRTTGQVTEETVLAADLPRPGLSGGAHAGTVTVWTVDARSGAPLPGTAVTLVHGNAVVRTRTDAGGRAVVSGIAPGALYDVSAGGRALTACSFVRALAAFAVLPLRAEERRADEIALGALEADAGATVPVPIRVSCAADTAACSLALAFDSQSIAVVGDGVGRDAANALQLAIVNDPYFAAVSFDNAQGWLVAGILFDSNLATSIRAGTVRESLFDLHVRVAGSGERVISLVNGQEHPAGVATYNVLTTLAGESVHPDGVRALITPSGGLSATETLAVEGGTLFANTEFDIRPSPAGSRVQVTGAVEAAGNAVLATPRVGMRSDVFGRVTAGGTTLNGAGARFLAEPGIHDLAVTSLGSNEKLVVGAVGQVPAEFGATPSTVERALLMGPSGLPGTIALELGRAVPGFNAAARNVSAQFELPRRWDLPVWLVAEVEAGGAASSYRRWVDATAPAPAQATFTFLAPPVLVAPAGSTSVIDVTARTTALRWQRVPEAQCYVLSLGDMHGSLLWQIQVPASTDAQQSVVLPPLPFTCGLLAHVPYLWSVAAIVTRSGTAAVSGAAYDVLGVDLGEERRASCAPRVLRLD